MCHGGERSLQSLDRSTISVYVSSAISLMSAPAANTFSPPYTTTARISALNRLVRCSLQLGLTCAFRAFIGGRSSRIVPIRLIHLEPDEHSPEPKPVGHQPNISGRPCVMTT